MPRMGPITNRGGVREGSGRPATGTSERAINRDRLDNVEALQLHMENYTYGEVSQAFIKFTAQRRGDLFAEILKKCIWEPRSRNQVLRDEESAAELVPKFELVEPTPLETIDALVLLLHQKLGKRQYVNIYFTINLATGVSLLPSYYQVALCKKLCRPDVGIHVTEIRASVEISALVQHTLQRILEHLGAEIDDRLSRGRRKTRDLTFLFSYGYDAATGQRMYKQKYNERQNINHSDSSLFAANMNPLLLRENDGTQIWLNPVPQSPWFVRPVILEFAKETREYVTAVQNELQGQINACRPFHFRTPGGIALNIRIQANLTMIDGKVFNHLYGTISQNCPICGRGPRDFNNDENLYSGAYNAPEERLCHGCQPLHAWIRFISHVFNLSYNIPVHNAKARGEVATEIRATKKRHVQREFLKDGLRIDFPAPNGSGSSMDGNTSRRAFRNYERLHEVTGVNLELLKRYWVILTCINNTRWKLKVQEFRNYCIATYHCYMREYRWYKLSPSIHKVLFHAADIQERLELPVGAYGEGAQETTHSDVKDIRIDSTRKNDRVNTNTDMLHRRLDNSDPIVASKIVARCANFRQTDEKALEDLPEDARNLLEIPRELIIAVRRAPTNVPRRAPGGGTEPENNHELEGFDLDEEEHIYVPLDEEPVQNYEYLTGDEPMDED